MGSKEKYFAIKNRYDKTFDITTDSGIYLGSRIGDNGITYGYVGKARNLKERHWEYYQIRCGLKYPARRFEASFKKHKDYNFRILETCPEGLLDMLEQKGINYYLAQPYHETRNELLTGKDQVRSNYHRVEHIKKKQKQAVLQCFKHLTTQLTSKGLTISLKYTKKGIPTALSKRHFEELLDILQLKGENNG